MTEEILPPFISSEARNLSSLRTPASLPRISLITPVLNTAKYIEQTFQSVLSQNYPDLEYFVIDGGSTDGTLDIIRKYEAHITGWLSEPDNGMYDALNKGFSRTTGEIMGWISATDKLHIGGLLVVGSAFRDLPREVEWITGRPTAFSEDGMTIIVHDIPRWSRYRFLAGANRYIQQESTYWRRSLWEKTGSHMDSSHRYASDFELWVRFFRYARLYPVNGLIGGFRVHGDSLGLQDLDFCHDLHDQFVEAELNTIRYGQFLRLFRRISSSVLSIPKVRGLWQRVVMKNLYQVPGPDWPPIIEYYADKWVLRK